MWPLDKRNRVANHVCFYEAGGFEKVGDTDKAATILQYALEGRLTACTLLQMVSKTGPTHLLPTLLSTYINRHYVIGPSWKDPFKFSLNNIAPASKTRFYPVLIVITPAQQAPGQSILICLAAWRSRPDALYLRVTSSNTNQNYTFGRLRDNSYLRFWFYDAIFTFWF